VAFFHLDEEDSDMNNKRKTLHAAAVIVASLAVLAGCSSVKLDDKPPVESRSGTAVTPGAGGAGQGQGGATESRVASVDLAKPVAADPNQRTVYFDFDSYVVKDEFRGIVESNAKVLVADRKKRLAIEGHTDERGGREYNLALGQKRAEAVAKSLTLLGATEAQMEAVSFGKERPAVQGSDEAAWAKNRRAELVYR
jgi:peptidoglycan-associated lipoprotein